MKNRLLLNLGLLALIAILLAVVYLEPGMERGAEPTPITRLVPEDVVFVSFASVHGEEITLERQGDGWYLTSPLQVRANDFRIEPLLRIVEAASHGGFRADPQALAQYGLAPPLVRLQVNDVELAFGTTEPLDGRRYVMVGDLVHLTDDHYYDRLQADAAAFASNSLLPEGARPERIDLPGLVLQADPEGRWRETPERDMAMDAVNLLVDSWVHARAILVGRYEGDEASEVITIRLRDGGQVLSFAVLETEHDLVLARTDLGLRYHMGSEQGRRLLQVGDEVGSE